MPNKVNPAITEMVTQVAIQVATFDQAITWAVGTGQVELNAFLLLIAKNSIASLKLLINTNDILAKKCIKDLAVDVAQCHHHAVCSRAIAMVLVPQVGYHQATAVARLMDDKHMDFVSAAQENTSLSKEVCEALITPEAVNALGFEGKGRLNEKD